MRIRKRQVPLPFSSISPVPLPSDPNFNRSPVVQLSLQQPTPCFDPRPSSDHPNNHPIGQLRTQAGRDSSAFSPFGEDNHHQKKGLNQGGEEEERGGEGEKSNDTRKKSVMGAQVGTGSFPESSSSHQAVGTWGEGEKSFPLKKRRGSFDRRGNNNVYDVDDDTIILEKDNSNKKVQMMMNNNKMKTKMNKKFVQQQNNDNHEQEESKDGIVTASVDSNNSNNNNNPSGAKKRGRGGALMEGSRCSRVNGRGWRCCQQTLVGYSLCEHHLGKGRLRSMTSVRSRSLAAKKEEQLPKTEDHHHQPQQQQQQPLSSNSSPSQQVKQIMKRESLGESTGEDGKEEEGDQKPLTMTKKRVKLGMVKARSISSLLGQNDNAIALAEDNN
ncbi:Growth-regulating factor 5 [Corchorus olitorius]|uniref:Growth-regulating factor 5 n=1 Tax=Corchorus olitorius TaxID=93759 RepID=A0A1R3HF70_9ROSI|nr:Growth-regulating factor 5 [Corchorus olitorius]